MGKKFFILWFILSLVFWLSNLAYAAWVAHTSISMNDAMLQLYTSLMFMFTVALVIMLIWYLVKKKK
jgi:membrane protein DedA with SNARE-associated domain